MCGWLIENNIPFYHSYVSAAHFEIDVKYLYRPDMWKFDNSEDAFLFSLVWSNYVVPYDENWDKAPPLQ